MYLQAQQIKLQGLPEGRTAPEIRQDKSVTSDVKLKKKKTESGKNDRLSQKVNSSL